MNTRKSYARIVALVFMMLLVACGGPAVAPTPTTTPPTATPILPTPSEGFCAILAQARSYVTSGCHEKAAGNSSELGRMTASGNCDKSGQEIEASLQALASANPNESNVLQQLSEGVKRFRLGESTFWASCTKNPWFKLALSEKELAGWCDESRTLSTDGKKQSLEDIDALVQKYGCQS